MEKYILIAHPDKFVCDALAAFLKPRSCYALESDDDLEFRIQDLNPACLIYHSGFKHDALNERQILDLFDQVPFYWIGGDVFPGMVRIEEPFDPKQLAARIIKDLESTNANN